MKKMKHVVVCLSVILLSSLLPLKAQKHLEEWTKKCETDDKAEITVINNRNSKTGEMEKTLIQISLKNDSPLLKELSMVIAKDKENANQLIENKINGVMMPKIMSFEHNKYIFDYGKINTEIVIVPNKRSKSSNEK